MTDVCPTCGHKSEAARRPGRPRKYDYEKIRAERASTGDGPRVIAKRLGIPESIVRSVIYG